MKLLEIQTELNAPKTQLNKFGGYNYRSCEDILSAVKPLLKKYSCTLWLDDEMVLVGNRVYVKATATFVDGDIRTISHGWAREEEVKKGMDSSQITGAASSYARKYALNALFLIDDNKDSDSTNEHGKEEPKPHSEPAKAESKPVTQGEAKRYIGHITDRKEGKMGFVSYTCGPMDLSTKMPAMIEKMDSAFDNNTNVQIDYTEVVNGRWTNRYIQSVAEVEPLPF